MPAAKNSTYTIHNTNGTSGGPWTRLYATRDAAADALRQAMGWDAIVLSGSYDDTRGNATWHAYESQDECDADETGALAPCITRY